MAKVSRSRHETIDQETAMSWPKHKKESKCFVYMLAAFVIFCAGLLVFACVMRVNNPDVKLTLATLNQISYRASPSSSFNASMIIHLRIKNPNHGGFRYENSSVNLLYRNVRVGGRVIRSDRVKAKETKEVTVPMDVRSVKLPVNVAGILSTEINSGTLNLTSYAKFSGTVTLLKIINKRKTIEMACIMNFNLISHSIQGIQC
ncbi:uncharacterized protein LOC133297701 [Gastrolobium bilobum]|uniref:uncharacterized protein LOC133297701 n=1 Tax=Gastrolobium bilobum TaxID=150636 RepID=UPI002AB2187A|nr:uncharacterized protein LOC133297701 [Gastrolobium bilobum]